MSTSRKRSVIVALIGLNALLLGALILSTHLLPAAYAQGRGRPGDFVMATCQVHEDYEAVAVVNIQQGALYVWIPKVTGKTVKLVPTGARNLNTDFRRP